jgi:hypothetical protein
VSVERPMYQLTQAQDGCFHLEGMRSGTVGVHSPHSDICCPPRLVLDRIGDKRSVLIVLNLNDGPKRSSELRELLHQTPKASPTLRGMEGEPAHPEGGFFHENGLWHNFCDAATLSDSQAPSSRYAKSPENGEGDASPLPAVVALRTQSRSRARRWSCMSSTSCATPSPTRSPPASTRPQPPR